jgi:hypothetical protein
VLQELPGLHGLLLQRLIGSLQGSLWAAEVSPQQVSVLGVTGMGLSWTRVREPVVAWAAAASAGRQPAGVAVGSRGVSPAGEVMMLRYWEHSMPFRGQEQQATAPAPSVWLRSVYGLGCA